MNLYLISQTENTGYDTYDSAVVCANSEDEARRIHPRSGQDILLVEDFYAWVQNPEKVTVKLIGTAGPDVKHGVVLSSFNAG